MDDRLGAIVLKKSDSENDEQYSIALARDHAAMIQPNASFESLLRESCPDRPSADFFNAIGQQRKVVTFIPEYRFAPEQSLCRGGYVTIARAHFPSATFEGGLVVSLGTVVDSGVSRERVVEPKLPPAFNALWKIKAP
jgi:hypothetical protein